VNVTGEPKQIGFEEALILRVGVIFELTIICVKGLLVTEEGVAHSALLVITHV
jgi:hypothetical protein